MNDEYKPELMIDATPELYELINALKAALKQTHMELTNEVAYVSELLRRLNVKGGELV